MADYKALIERFVQQAFNEGNLNAVNEVYAERFVSRGPFVAEGEKTPVDVKAFVGAYRGAFPDGQTTIEAQIVEGDTLAYRWRYRGTHYGELMGIAPTGRQVTINGITMVRFEGGKIVEEWNSWDALALLQQLGVEAMPTGG